MAHSARLSTLTDELVTSLTGLRSNTNPREFRRAKDVAAKGLRAQQYVRVNQFDIQTKLEGLEEKFVVLDREDLAQAFKSRVDEFAKIPHKWGPEFFALLLELADDPVANSSVDALKLCRPPSPPPQLTWDEILADDPLNEEGLWDDIDYRVASSDDGSSEDLPVTPRSTRALKKQTDTDGQEKPSAEYVSIPVNEDVLDEIRDAQFWQRPDAELETASQPVISELQIIRETLFMLAGLPTSLFTVSGSNIQLNHTHPMDHAQVRKFDSILRSLSAIGSRLFALRHWVKREQKISLLQTFRAAVQRQLTLFDMELAKLQKRYLNPRGGIVVSLIDVRREIDTLSATASRLADIALKKSGETPFSHLEALFDEIDLALLSGEAEVFAALGHIFFQCFQTYLKPLRRWTEDGELDLHNDVFFIAVAQSGKETNGASLWHDRFELRHGASGDLFAPGFLQPAAKSILNAGKSVVFLKELGFNKRDISSFHTEPILEFNITCGQQDGLPLTPFSELFYSAFNNWVRSKYSQASSILREQLFTNCGLTSTLRALETIYLSQDGSLFQNFADAVFMKIDRNTTAWNDRFVLTELAQIAFGEGKTVDAERISVRSRKIEGKSRNMKNLASFVVDYQISWPVLNLIQRSSLRIYQQILCFILQAYRAKYLLQQICSTGSSIDPTTRAFIYYLRQRLIWFADTFRSYLTDIVICQSNIDLHTHLQNAEDIDAMAAVHSQYVSRLQASCLLSKNFAPIHGSIVNILELSIQLYDTQLQLSMQSPKPADLRQSVRRTWAPARPNRDRRRTMSAADIGIRSGDESTSDEDKQSDYDADDDSAAPSQNKSCQDQLANIWRNWESSLHFVIAGLRGVSRGVGVGNGEVVAQCWETLAERLEWGVSGNHKTSKDSF